MFKKHHKKNGTFPKDQTTTLEFHLPVITERHAIKPSLVREIIEDIADFIIHLYLSAPS